MSADPDRVYAEVVEGAAAQGLTLYPHQDEAVLELLSGQHVILATPTGSGKSLVAAAAHSWALAQGERSFYTAPIKALVSEKFFSLCAQFGADRVGMLTGDASVNPEAPIIACTAEILANMALRQGSDCDVGLVVMDEFHYYGDPQRGWAWQVPLLELRDVQFLLMSATLGDVADLAADLTRRTGRECAVITEADRPVPLTFTWSMTPLPQTVADLVSTGQGPVYVVHFTQAGAVEQATALLTVGVGPVDRPGIAAAMGGFRFGPGFGRTLSKLLRSGIGVHHAGMLPKYRRLVETLAQEGLLRVVCGTDTLGVGINVPIRTVLFTGLVKYDGSRERVLRAREFHQIAGRAGRAGFDTIGHVVVQAPEHVIDNERAKAKAEAKNAANPKKRSKPQLKKAPEGTVVWSEQTFDKLVRGRPEPLPSRMRVDNAMLVNVLARDEDAFPVLRRLLMDNHEPHRNQLRLARRAIRLARSLVRSGVLVRLDHPDACGRRYVLTVDLPEDFALNEPLSHFALAALDVLDRESPTYPLDVVSVMEAVLASPRPVLMAQRARARAEAVAAMKAEGLDYDERMRRLEEVTWPQPLAELLEALFATYRQTHPWLPDDALAPKSVVREMWEQGWGFTDTVSRFGLARSEGLLLRYLSDAYRILRHTVPASHRTSVLEELVDWLGETVRQTDSSLVDEWEALTHPEEGTLSVGPAPPRPLSAQQAFHVMIRNAMFARVLECARDRPTELARLEQVAAGLTDPPRVPVLTERRWDEALAAYYAEHDTVLTDADARGPSLLWIGSEEEGRIRRVRQTLSDPAGYHDWVIDAVVDVAASDEVGELVLGCLDLHRLGG